MNTKYKTAAAAAAALAEEPAIEQRVSDEVTRGQFVSALIALRLEKGITQQQIATAMGCDPSTISRLESGSDIRLSELMGYLGALKIHMCVLFDDPSLPMADRIKQHVFEIHRHLESLASMAKNVEDDRNFVSKIHEFYGEVLLNFLLRFEDSRKKLPSFSFPKQQVPTSVVELPSESSIAKKSELAPA